MAHGLPRSLARGAPGLKTATRYRIEFEDVPVSVSAVSTAKGFGTAVVGELPDGLLYMQAVRCDIDISGPGSSADLSDTWNGDFSLGSAPTADVSLGDAGEANIIPSTATGVAAAEVSAGNAANTDGTVTVIDNEDGTGEINFNFLVDAADIADDSTVAFTVSGSVEFVCIVM